VGVGPAQFQRPCHRERENDIPYSVRADDQKAPVFLIQN